MFEISRKVSHPPSTATLAALDDYCRRTFSMEGIMKVKCYSVQQFYALQYKEGTPEAGNLAGLDHQSGGYPFACTNNFSPVLAGAWILPMNETNKETMRRYQEMFSALLELVVLSVTIGKAD